MELSRVKGTESREQRRQAIRAINAVINRPSAGRLTLPWRAGQGLNGLLRHVMRYVSGDAGVWDGSIDREWHDARFSYHLDSDSAARPWSISASYLTLPPGYIGKLNPTQVKDLQALGPDIDLRATIQTLEAPDHRSSLITARRLKKRVRLLVFDILFNRQRLKCGPSDCGETLSWCYGDSLYEIQTKRDGTWFMQRHLPPFVQILQGLPPDFTAGGSVCVFSPAQLRELSHVMMAIPCLSPRRDGYDPARETRRDALLSLMDIFGWPIEDGIDVEVLTITRCQTKEEVRRIFGGMALALCGPGNVLDSTASPHRFQWYSRTEVLYNFCAVSQFDTDVTWNLQILPPLPPPSYCPRIPRPGSFGVVRPAQGRRG